MKSLSARETLGIYLGQRAGYWIEKKDWQAAKSDIDLAYECFPNNVDIQRGRRLIGGRAASVVNSGQRTDYRQGEIARTDGER